MTPSEITTKIHELKGEQARNELQIPFEFYHYQTVWKRNQWIGREITRLEAL